MSKYIEFTKEMKQTHTILVPQMLPIHFQFLSYVMNQEGYHVEVLQTIDDKIIEEGLSHVHNDTCYPALLVIGQMIHALKSGKYDLDHVALAITQTAGGCRASNYLSLLRKAIEMEGWEIPIISLNFAGLEKQSGFQLTLPMIVKLAYAMLYGDAMMWLNNQIKPYEIRKGESDQVIQELIHEICESMHQGYFMNSKAVYANMIERMKRIETNSVHKIRVGIVGEIYMKYAPLGNRELEKFLIEEGFEPVLSGVMDFALYCLENGIVDYKYYHRSWIGMMIQRIGKSFIMHEQQKFIDMINEDGRFRAPDCFKTVETAGSSFIDKGVKMGEGWLLTSEMVSLLEDGVNNIIAAQPFGCLPNHIVAKGMMRKLKRAYPQSNIVAIDYDPSASRVNQENRIRLMLANAKLGLNLEKEPVRCFQALKKEQYA